jgi:hypothetical protein
MLKLKSAKRAVPTGKQALKQSVATMFPRVVPREPPPAGAITVTVQRGAAILDTGPGTIWKLIAAGELSSFSIGRRRLITLKSIEDFVARQELKARGQPPRPSPLPKGRSTGKPAAAAE